MSKIVLTLPCILLLTLDNYNNASICMRDSIKIIYCKEICIMLAKTIVATYSAFINIRFFRWMGIEGEI